MTVNERSVPDAFGVEVGGWYTYEFPARPSIQCAFGPGCDVPHPVYIGKTNEPWRRHFEHLDKPWLDLTAGYQIHPRTYATEREALAAETAMIHARLPLANVRANEGNRHRLEFGVVRHRVAVRPARRPVARPGVRPRRRAAWLVLRSRWFWLTLAWLVLAASVWWAAHRALHLPAQGGAVAGGVGATLLLVWATGQGRSRRRRRRR